MHEFTCSETVKIIPYSPSPLGCLPSVSPDQAEQLFLVEKLFCVLFFFFFNLQLDFCF